MRWLHYVLLTALSVSPWVARSQIVASGSDQSILRVSEPSATMQHKLVSIGRKIYLEGVLQDGTPLVGTRTSGGALNGLQAACVNCHRRSGLGSVEGTLVVPPITGRALFGSGDEPVTVRQDKRFEIGYSVQKNHYTEATLASAVRAGLKADGSNLSPVMPRFTLDDDQVRAVAAYLSTLSAQWSAGVGLDDVQVATVIAPGVSEARRQAFVSTLQTMLGQMNMNATTSFRQKVPAIERRTHARRKLHLHIWELTGPSADWPAQLEALHQAQPVFAVLSGLSESEWQPVQDFCDQHKVGCWLPSLTMVPSNAAQSPYSVYFSAGVATEAQVVLKSVETTNGRVVQLISDDVVARHAASLVTSALRGVDTSQGKRRVDEVVVSNTTAKVLARTVADLKSGDTLILWLRPSELAQLKTISKCLATVYVSAILGGDEEADVPTTVRRNAYLVQTQEQLGTRSENLERFKAWMVGSKLKIIDERIQSEVYFSARSFQYIVRGMLGNMYTDYLIERAESSLSMFEAAQVQDEIQSMMMTPVNKRPPSRVETSEASQAKIAQQQTSHLFDLRKRGGTTVYPRLNLAQGQRIASKGAYLERLNPKSRGVVGEPDWIVP